MKIGDGVKDIKISLSPSSVILYWLKGERCSDARKVITGLVEINDILPPALWYMSPEC